MSSVLALREFMRMRWDPRALLVDCRQTTGAPLDNPFFAWVRVASRAQIDHLAGDISQRHLIVVGEDEEHGLEISNQTFSLSVMTERLHHTIAQKEIVS